jgi:uncharacterized protein (TIGR00106 family)
MSVIVELTIFPTDKGESVSAYVARALDVIQASGLPYELNPMGTVIEGEWEDVMGVVSRCLEELKKDSKRIYLALKADYREGPVGRMQSKVSSVREKLR